MPINIPQFLKISWIIPKLLHVASIRPREPGRGVTSIWICPKLQELSYHGATRHGRQVRGRSSPLNWEDVSRFPFSTARDPLE